MQYTDKYREPDTARSLVRAIRSLKIERELRIMEVCGTHTVSIFRAGIRSLLPGSIRLIAGPGCPVCVTSQREIDTFIALAGLKGVAAATFGDLMRVPGTARSLAGAKARGADVRVVYSPLEALKMAQDEPRTRFVFLGVGFETTAPTIAAAALKAQAAGVDNFFVAPAMKLVPPALKALLESGEIDLHGLILPGHVSTIIGKGPYEEVLAPAGVPGVIAGFEPVDVLMAILMLAKKILKGSAGVDVQYSRAVSDRGNPKAREVMETVFEPRTVEWRGLGPIPASGLVFRPPFSDLDAPSHFGIDVPEASEPKGCLCGEVIKGKVLPPECPLYKKSCTPSAPVGPCMVSSEGTCAAYHRYSGK